MTTIWVVVADEAIARILQWHAGGHELTPVEELADPAAHAKEAELRRDAYGRRAGSGAQSGRPGGGPQTLRTTGHLTASAGEAERHLQADRFARRVAERLHEALLGQRFEQLRIVAAPRFLGLLRKALTPDVARTLTHELDKDLVHQDTPEIARRLFPGQAAGKPTPV